MIGVARRVAREAAIAAGVAGVFFVLACAGVHASLKGRAQ